MSAELSFSKEGFIGCITLDRPKALHALTLDMVKAVYLQLQAWKKDDSVQAVCISATPSPAFCAGGDVRSLYEAGSTAYPKQMDFFWHEYRMNHAIHHLGKPYIALMDGITMGGGVGISLHGSHPIASERFVFAMPETSIGFFPDIGASHLLNRCPQQLGYYLGLSGNRLGPTDAKRAGLIKAIVPSDAMPELSKALFTLDLSQDAVADVDACIAQFASKTEEPSSLEWETIERCFAEPTIEAIQQALQRSTPWAQATEKTLHTKCPLSLKITLAQLQKSVGLSLAECLQMDYTLVGHFMQGSNFYEGVRALLIDKDKNPQWDPVRLEEVTKAMVIPYFEQRDLLSFE